MKHEYLLVQGNFTLRFNVKGNLRKAFSFKFLDERLRVLWNNNDDFVHIYESNLERLVPRTTKLIDVKFGESTDSVEPELSEEDGPSDFLCKNELFLDIEHDFPTRYTTIRLG